MSGIDESKLGALIDRIYEAAARQELWRSLLHDVGEVFGGVGAILLPGPKAPVAAVWSEALDQGVEIGMRDGWYANNPRVTRGVPALANSRDIVTEQRIFTQDELERMPFNVEFIRATGMGSFAGMLLVPAGSSSIILSIERSAKQEPFSPREIETLMRVLPHFQRAGQLAIQLGATHANGMLDAFEMMSCGGVLLDFLGRVVRMNAQAERCLGQGLLLAHGQLTVEHRETNGILQHLIGAALRPGPAHEGNVQDAVSVPRPQGRPLVIHVAPIVGSVRDLFQTAKAILLIVDPDEHQEPSVPLLRQAFSLSPAEARLAVAIAAGRDLGEIAADYHVSYATLRTQLKSIFAKTSTHRQAELAALVTRMTTPSLAGSVAAR